MKAYEVEVQLHTFLTLPPDKMEQLVPPVPKNIKDWVGLIVGLMLLNKEKIPCPAKNLTLMPLSHPPNNLVTTLPEISQLQFWLQ
jgi:hypothetical protein